MEPVGDSNPRHPDYHVFRLDRRFQHDLPGRNGTPGTWLIAPDVTAIVSTIAILASSFYCEWLLPSPVMSQGPLQSV